MPMTKQLIDPAKKDGLESVRVIERELGHIAYWSQDWVGRGAAFDILCQVEKIEHALEVIKSRLRGDA